MSDSSFSVAKKAGDALRQPPGPVYSKAESGWDLRSLSSIVGERMSFLTAPLCLLKCWQFYAAVGVAAILLKRYYNSKHPIYRITKSLKGKVYLVTGASAGIGTETVKELAKHGAVVHCLCRDLPKAQRVLGPFQAEYGKENVQIHELDLCDLSSVRRFAEKFLATNSPIHCLINNAGMISTSLKYTKDGFETTMQANHLGHFLLTKLLLDRIKQTAPSRIVVLSSLGHTFVRQGEFDVSDVNFRNHPYIMDGLQSYCWSKFENILFTRELARRLYKQGVTVNAVHPGGVKTELARARTFWNTFLNPMALYFFIVGPFTFKNAYQGAQTTLYVAIDDQLEHVSGAYFSDCKSEAMTVTALDDQMAEDFWQESERMIAGGS